jgi:hypothetical protein
MSSGTNDADAFPDGPDEVPAGGAVVVMTEPAPDADPAAVSAAAEPVAEATPEPASEAGTGGDGGPGVLDVPEHADRSPAAARPTTTPSTRPGRRPKS